MTRRIRPRLLRDRRGVTLVEFALGAPVMLLLLMGLMDLGFRLYIQSILTGAMQRAGRDMALESGASRASALDAAVVSSVRQVVSNATWQSSRQSYSNYGAIAPEPFTDLNRNGVRDPGECYSDINNNSAWDQDPGRTGLGSASDTVLYTMVIRYPRIFPLGAWLGGPPYQEISSRMILMNQPYSTQNIVAPTTRCT